MAWFTDHGDDPDEDSSGLDDIERCSLRWRHNQEDDARDQQKLCWPFCEDRGEEGWLVTLGVTR